MKEWQLPRETGTENQQLAQEVKILQRTAQGQTKIKVTFKIMLERRQVLFEKKKLSLIVNNIRNGFFGGILDSHHPTGRL